MDEAAADEASGARTRTIGTLLVALAATGYASATVSGGLAFRSGADMEAVVLSRLAIGALVLWGVVLARRLRLAVPRGRWPMLGWMGLLSSAVGVLLFAAVQRIPVSTTTLQLDVHPAMVAVITVGLRRERLTAGKGAALAVGLTGVLLVLGAPVERLDPVGVVLALGAALTLAVYVVTAQTGARGIPPALVGAVVLTTATVIYLPPAFTAGVPHAGHAPGRAWLVVVGLATGSAVAAFLAGLARLGPIRASIGATVEPVMAVILSALLLAEVLSPVQFGGAALVIAAVAVLPLTRG
jgi:drug/metabolite transporter (DMT)-like permease